MGNISMYRAAFFELLKSAEALFFD